MKHTIREAISRLSCWFPALTLFLLSTTTIDPEDEVSDVSAPGDVLRLDASEDLAFLAICPTEEEVDGLSVTVSFLQECR